MSDPQATAPSTPQPVLGESRILAIICYVLFIAVFTNGISSIVGVVLAYIKRADAKGTIWESHFDNLIQLFWTGLAMLVVFAVAAVFGILGAIHVADTNHFTPAVLLLPALWLAGVLYLVWYLYRSVKGLLRALENKPYA